MTIKDNKKSEKTKIAFLSLKQTLITMGVVGVITLIILGINKLSHSRQLKAKVNNAQRELEYKHKIDTFASNKFDVVCEKKIIKKDNYTLTLIDKNYRVFVGDDNKDLDSTYKLNRCSIIEVVK